MTTLDLTTKSFSLQNAIRFANSVSGNSDTYYLVAGCHVPFQGGVVPQPYDNVYQTQIDFWNTMIFGKKITSNSVSFMVRNIPYTFETIYAPYDDSDPLIFSKNFYAVVNANALSHVFKCLDNAGGAPSTVEPNFSDVDAADDSYRTSDGYLWKYLFTVDATTIQNFATPNFFPYLPNNAVQAAAQPGSLEVVTLVSPGNNYTNYLSGTFSFQDVKLNGNNLLYAVNPQGSPYNTFYNDCVIYITADVLGNSAGQFRTVTNYQVNSTAKYITLDSPFDAIPQNGAQYQIQPGVLITGDGLQTVNAAAWAVVNTSTNTISRVDVLRQGRNYKYATASVIAANVVGAVPAVVRPIYSPGGGHGADPLSELGCTTVGLSMAYSNTEGNTIPNDCSYQRIGLIKNPLFANVTLALANQIGVFVGSESVYKVRPVALKATGALASNTTLTAPDGDFLNQLNVGDNLILTTNGSCQLNMVVGVTNSSVAQLASNATITSNAVTISKTALYTSSIVLSPSLGQLQVGNVNGVFAIGDQVIGSITGATAYVNSVSRSGVAKDFSTFVQTTTYQATPLLGSFQLNETVYQGDITSANAQIASLTSNGSALTLRVTNEEGVFDLNTNVVGATSGAIAVLTNKYDPELVFASGNTLFIENSDPVNRATITNAEVFKLMLEF